jgi:hypothetical protein
MMLQLVAHLNHSLAQHREAPVAWRTQVQGIIAANEAALANETSAPQEIARCRAGLQQVESAAQQWPAIWKRCAAEPLWERLPVP